MTTESFPAAKEQQTQKSGYRAGASETVYGLGFLGALVYYISHAATFWLGVLGLFKAALWPAILVYELLNYLGK